MTIQRQLSNQAELVHQLDPEPVFDYLLQHRALDQSAIDLIKDEENTSDRNIKLLKHLEELGNPAIELFINALRQSGQMHLASLLDVEHRIKPVIGKGYWEKQRYKGQVTISLQLLAAKVLVRKDSDEDKSPRIVDINAMLTPFKVKHSYENMTLLGENENGTKARRILEYSYEEESKKSCWCCLPFWCCSSRTKKKKELERREQERLAEIQKSAELNVSKNGADLDGSVSNSSLDLCDVMVSLPAQPSSPIKSGSTFFKTRRLSPTIESPETQSLLTKSDSVDRNSNHQLSDLSPTSLSDVENGILEVKFDTVTEEVSVSNKKAVKSEKRKKKGGKKNIKETEIVKINNHRNDKASSERADENKENGDPSILDSSPAEKERPNGKHKTQSSSKLTPPTTLNTSKDSSSMKRSETYELVERWKSEGLAYKTARDQFFTFFDNAIQSRIIRYFEQNRSTLVLQVGLQDGMSVCTICMTTREVKKLREDYEMGVLHEELVQCVNPQDIIDKMECVAIHLRTVIDDEDFTLSYQELS